MRRLAVEMLKEAPTPALRACAPLAQVYQPLAWELFNAAFIACWSELTNRMEIATGGFKAATRTAPLDHTHASASRPHPAASRLHRSACVPRRSPSSPLSSSRWMRSLRRPR